MPHRRTYAFAQKMMSDGRNDYRRQISSAKANRKHALFDGLKFRGCFPCVMGAVIIRRLYTSSVADGKDGRKRRTETADGNSRRKWPTENQRIFHGPVDRLDERLVSGWHLRCAHNKCHLRILMEMRGSGQTHLL